MGKISLLDCTLRDGGYVNDWEFGRDNLISIFERLVDTKVEIVEVGFLDERRPYDVNRSIFPNTKIVDEIWNSVLKKPPMVVGMIDYGTCGIENISDCNDSFLDGIRVIFKKGRMHEAMNFCAEIKAKGYKVFSQLVSITAYNEDELLELVELVNDVQPYAVSIVDTYGLLDPTRLLYYYSIIDQHLLPDIQIGFHAHNNLQLAYANARAFLDRPTNRDVVVDGTLFGMGKSAGNAPIELLGWYLNHSFGKSYDLRSMLEAIEESIKPFYQKTPWGYKTFFYLCAVNECHPSYVEYFQSKENLSFSKLYELLSSITPEEKKLLYDKNLAEKLYQNYMKEHMSDEDYIAQLKRELNGKKVLLIGPGKNIKLQKEKVDAYIVKNRPIIISVNYIPQDVAVDYVFATKSNRYKEMAVQLLNEKIKIIATSNLECKNGDFAFRFNRESLIESREEIKDNSFLMLLRILKRAEITDISCAGFDGYSEKEDNYALPGMEYDFVKQAAAHLNQHIREVLTSEYENMKIDFITYSKYAVWEDIYSAAY